MIKTKQTVNKVCVISECAYRERLFSHFLQLSHVTTAVLPCPTCSTRRVCIYMDICTAHTCDFCAASIYFLETIALYKYYIETFIDESQSIRTVCRSLKKLQLVEKRHTITANREMTAWATLLSAS